MSDEGLERLKHGLRIREILLDKLVLAVVLAALGFYANQRLARYEGALDRQLEQLRSVYNFQRILDQREIEAHERAWKAVSDFRAFVDTKREARFSGELADSIEAEAHELSAGLEVETLYLTPRSKEAVDRFLHEDLNDLIEAWPGENGRDRLSRDAWDAFTNRVADVRNVIAGDIQAKRGSGAAP